MALTNAQYDAVMRSFEKRRLDNRHKQEERIREVYRAIPRMEKFDREIGAVALEQAKRLLGGRGGRSGASPVQAQRAEGRK